MNFPLPQPSTSHSFPQQQQGDGPQFHVNATTTPQLPYLNPFSPSNFSPQSVPPPPPPLPIHHQHQHVPTRPTNLRHSILPSPPPPPAQISQLEVTSLSPTHRSNPKSPLIIRRIGPKGLTFLPRFEPRDLNCAFCGGDSSRNKHSRKEEMVSCYECGSSGHPTCLDWDDSRLVKKVKSYNWLCQECKRCEVCDEKGDDVSFFTNFLFTFLVN
jgi:transcription elongation factor Elf1